jgi:hypothetical protein
LGRESKTGGFSARPFDNRHYPENEKLMPSGLAGQQKLLRIIDANFNRAKEGVRVSEDLARFVFEDKKLAASFKKLRHELSKILLGFPVPYARLLKSRNSKGDVAKKHDIRDSKSMEWTDLMTANLKRSQEAIRVLEECSKMISPKHASRFARLRFLSYELEKRSLRKF